MSKTVGYIVNDGRRPLWEENRKWAVEERGVLFYAYRGVTVFPTRSAARCAIRRSITYTDRHSLPWNRDYKIQRLVSRD